MTHELVMEMLEGYRVNVGRVEHLENLYILYIEQYGKMDRAELMVGGSHPMTGMPHGTTNGSPTSSIALLLADGYIPEMMADGRELIDATLAEFKEKRAAVVFVEAWLKGLTDRERWMVEGKIIGCQSWEEMRIEYNRKYGQQCSRATLKRLKACALEKIFNMAR